MRTKSQPNGVATKSDLIKLELRIDKRFEQVDKRFEQVDKRFEQVDKRFEDIQGRLNWFKYEWRIWKQDTFRLFEHRWQQFVDPVLKELETIRQEQVMYHGQYQRLESMLTKIGDKIGVQFD